MLDISSREEFVRAIRSNSVVLIGYYDSESEMGKFFGRVYKELTKHVDPQILVLRVDTNRAVELSCDLKSSPCIRVYYMGKLVFEQRGFFGDLDLDLYVLRRSIRSVLRSYNLTYRV